MRQLASRLADIVPVIVPDIVPVIVAVVALLGPRVAAACLPNPPTIEETIPAPLATHPANAGVALMGSQLTATALTAEVNGETATVETDLELSVPDYFWDYEALVLRTTPAPTPGQTVRLFGNACPEAVEPCALDLEYTAGEPDLEPPPAPAGLWFDAYDNGEPPLLNCDCTSFGLGQYVLSIEAAFVDPMGEPSMHALATRPQTEPDAELTIHERSWGTWAYAQPAWTEPQGGGSLGEAFCAVAYNVDLAGNKSAALETCEACRDQALPGGCNFICDGPPCGFPSFECESIVHPAACPQSVLDECEFAGTTGDATTGDATTGAAATTAGTTDTQSTGVTSDASSSTGVAGDSEATGTPGAGMDAKGCACDAREHTDAAMLWLLLLPIAAAARRRRSLEPGCSNLP